jgi:flagellar hook-associated protein 2
MASISTAGVGSGLDVNSIVTQLMAVERQPLTALDTKEASYQAKLSAYGTLKSAISSIQSAARSLKSTTLFSSLTASSSNSSVVSASASTAAQAGSYTIKVLARAQAQSISSQSVPNLTTDLAADVDNNGTSDAGKLKIELGTYAAQVGTAQVGTAQVGTAQVGTAQVGTAEVGIFGDPGYVPASPDYVPASPDYVPASPDYMPASPDYVPASANYVASSFSAKAGTTPVTIDIAAGTSSLSDIRDAINAANAGIKANLVYVGTEGYKLTLTSTSTGVTSSIKLTAMDASNTVLTNNTGLGKLSFDPAKTAGNGNEFAVNTIAQDASFTVDGVALTRSTNSISDALTGVTLSLGDTLNTNTTLTIAKDTTSAKTALSTFVQSYNDLNSQLRQLTAYNTDTKQASLLTGDSGARSLQTALREMIAYRQPGSTGIAHSLSDLGVAMQRDGSLVFNSTKFDTALASSTTDVSTLFTSTSTTAPGIAVRMGKVLDGMLASSGLIASHTEGINRSITDIDRRRSTLGVRLAQIEKRYRAQFSSLDTLVASMQKTSEFLTQQLANLPSTSA